MTKTITAGQDSFLDIVANLVGILIILVVLVGAQAKEKLKQTSPDANVEQQLLSLREHRDRASDLALKLDLDQRQLESQVLEQNQLAAALADQRHRMLMQLELTRQNVETKREAQKVLLTAFNDEQQREKREQLQRDQDRIHLQSELESVSQSLAALSAEAGPKVEQLDHYPNPIAKTVFSEEIHFRLCDGRLIYVPLDELVAQMKSEWRVKAEKLQQASLTRETVGPIDGFRLQYELSATMVPQATERGVIEQRMVQFDRFHVIPQPGVEGETVGQALTAGSDFQKRLAKHPAGQTTVSVWVYPQDFAAHREIKGWLYEHGYQMASWPLETGRHISGGPNGFKTSAQ